MNTGTEISSLIKAQFSKKTENPFVGLRPFDATESHLFFGRDRQIKDILQKLHTNRFLAIIGSSGCGKSSLIRAGVIPKLQGGFLTEQRDYWLIATMRPSGDPLLHFIEAITGTADSPEAIMNDIKFQIAPDSLKTMGVREFINVMHAGLDNRRVNLLILVDQFEELFTYKTSSETQKNENIFFVNLLLELSKETTLPVYTVITMRSDYIGHCNRFFGLPELMNDAQYLVPRLRWQEIREVIANPIKLFNQEINPGLLDMLTNDSDKELDQLPVLQHCMMRTYQNWINDGKAGQIDFKHYNKTDGLAGAISQHAYEVFEKLSNTQKKVAEYMFRCITDSNADYEPVRRPQQFKNLEAVCSVVTGNSKMDLIEVINSFRKKSCAFLTPHEEVKEISENTVIDISHESLMRQWAKLKDWIKVEQRSSDKLYWLSESVIDQREYLRGWDIHDAVWWMEKQKPNNEWANRYVHNLPDVLRYIEKSKTSSQKRKWVFYGSMGLAVLAITTALVGFINLKKEKTESALKELKSNFVIASAKATKDSVERDNALYKLKVESAETEKLKAKAKLDSLKEAENRAKGEKEKAEIKVKIAQLLADEQKNMLAIQGEFIKKTDSIRTAAMGNVLDLTKEKFYQSAEINPAKKRQFVLELINAKYEHQGSDSSASDLKFKSFLSALNKTATGLDAAKEDPNLGLWIVGKAYQTYNDSMLNSVFSDMTKEYLFCSRKFEFPLGYGSAEASEDLIAVSKTNDLLAFPHGDSIYISKIQPDTIFIKSAFSIPKTNNARSKRSPLITARLQKLFYNDNNLITALVNDSVFYTWSKEGILLSIKNIVALNRNEIKKVSPDGSRVIYRALNKKAIQIWNIKNAFLEADIDFPDSLGALLGIEVSSDSKRYLIWGDKGLSIGNIGKVNRITNKIGSFTGGGRFINNNCLILFSRDGQNIQLLDTSLKTVSKINIGPKISSGHEVAGIQISPDWKKLLIQVLSKSGRKSFLLCEKNQKDSIFIWGDVTGGRSSGLTVKNAPNSMAVGFLDSNLILAYHSGNYQFSISQWKKYDEITVGDVKLGLMPPLSYRDKLNYEIINIEDIKNEDSLNLIVKNGQLLTIDRPGIVTYYTAYKTLAERYGTKYWKGFDSASRLVFDYYRDTLMYCNDLIRMTNLGELILLSGEDSKTTKNKLSIGYGRLAFWSLFFKETNYDSVIKYASRGLELDSPTNDWIYTNLALGYLLSGKQESAYKIYRNLKDSYYTRDRKPFKNAFLEDFNDLELAGIISPNKGEVYERVKKIRKFLRGEIEYLD